MNQLSQRRYRLVFLGALIFAWLMMTPGIAPAEHPIASGREAGNEMAASADAAQAEDEQRSEMESEEYQRLRDIQSRHVDDVMAIEGVVGMGIGKDKDGTYQFEIYVKKRTEELEDKLPKTLEGVKVHIIATGEVRPL